MERFHPMSSIRVALAHALAWAVYAGVTHVINLVNRTPLSLSQTFFVIVLLALVFYPVLWFLYRFFPRKKYVAGTLALVVYLLIPLPATYYLAVYRWYPVVGVYLPIEHVAFSIREFFTNYGVWVVRITVYALVYYNVERKISESRERARAAIGKSEAESKALRAEKEKLALETAALSAQVSPHLLSNILYKLYDSAVTQHPEHPGRLLLLAEVAAYATEATRPEGVMASIQEEIETIHKMEQLVDAAVEYRGDLMPGHNPTPAHLRIPRLCMVSLFENALKYCPRTKGTRPIRLFLKVTREEFTFSCTNPIGTARRHGISSGTGLANLRRRLQIHYGDAASLVTRDMPDAFGARLQIAFRNTNTERKE